MIVIAIDEWKCKKKVNGRWTLLMVMVWRQEMQGPQCSCGYCPRRFAVFLWELRKPGPQSASLFVLSQVWVSLSGNAW